MSIWPGGRFGLFFGADWEIFKFGDFQIGNGYLRALVSKLKECSAGSDLLLAKEKCNRKSKAECCQMSETWGIGHE